MTRMRRAPSSHVLGPIRGFHGAGGAPFGSDVHVGPAAHGRIGRCSLQRQLPQLSELKPLMRLGSFTRIAPTGFTRFMHAGGETGGVLTADDDTSAAELTDALADYQHRRAAVDALLPSTPPATQA